MTAPNTWPVIAALRSAGRLALDAVLPARCLGCAGPVEMQGALCAGCWSRITFLGPPCCACCGLPFDFDPGGGPGGPGGEETLCGSCTAARPAYRRARGAFAYDDGSRGLVLGFKHGDQTHAALPFGHWLRRAGAELLTDAELIVPVPLHRWRLFRRRYNQAALLALALGRLAGVAVAADLLVRHRATPIQGGLSRKGRARNVRGAFAIRPGRAPLIEDRRVLLIDDVLTTGATLSECTRVLRRGGAASVDVLTLARVIRPSG